MSVMTNSNKNRTSSIANNNSSVDLNLEIQNSAFSNGDEDIEGQEIEELEHEQV